MEYFISFLALNLKYVHAYCNWLSFLVIGYELNFLSVEVVLIMKIKDKVKMEPVNALFKFEKYLNNLWLYILNI